MSISPASIRGCGMLLIALGAVACGGDPESADAGAEAEMDAGAERGIQMMASGEESTLPPGAIVVKENYMPDSTFAAVTVMYKAELYDPANTDLPSTGGAP